MYSMPVVNLALLLVAIFTVFSWLANFRPKTAKELKDIFVKVALKRGGEVRDYNGLWFPRYNLPLAGCLIIVDVSGFSEGSILYTRIRLEFSQRSKDKLYLNRRIKGLALISHLGACAEIGPCKMFPIGSNDFQERFMVEGTRKEFAEVILNEKTQNSIISFLEREYSSPIGIKNKQFDFKITGRRIHLGIVGFPKSYEDLEANIELVYGLYERMKSFGSFI